MGQLIGTSSTAALDWRAVSPAEAGFADDLVARLDKAIAEKRVWNLHSIIVVRNGRLVLERYFDGLDDARGRPLGMVSFKADTLHDLRSASKSIVGLLYGIALAAGRYRHRISRSCVRFPNTPISLPTPIAAAGLFFMSFR
jgi:CubicO group peptidase (beta-lactamase class C family)